MASLFSSAASALLGSVSAAVDNAKNWGKNIHWMSLKEGQRFAKEHKRPAMIVFHKPWCRACKALRPRFANSEEIEQLSNDFIMISVEEDEFPRSSELSPDGSYIPRILFLDVDGSVLGHVYNEQGRKQYKYYYSETGSIVESMKKVLKQAASRNGKKDK